MSSTLHSELLTQDAFIEIKCDHPRNYYWSVIHFLQMQVSSNVPCIAHMEDGALLP